MYIYYLTFIYVYNHIYPLYVSPIHHSPPPAQALTTSLLPFPLCAIVIEVSTAG